MSISREVKPLQGTVDPQFFVFVCFLDEPYGSGLKNVELSIKENNMDSIKVVHRPSKHTSIMSVYLPMFEPTRGLKDYCDDRCGCLPVKTKREIRFVRFKDNIRIRRSPSKTTSEIWVYHMR